MAIRRLFVGLAIGILILGVTSAVVAETLNFKWYSHVVKSEIFVIPDKGGHEVGLNIRDTVCAFENGDVAFGKGIVFIDRVLMIGSINQYTTYTFRDGSTIVIHTAGTTTFSGEIIYGTGRFQGIKGTATISPIGFFPLEQGEASPKNYGNGTFVYTLPSK